MPFHRSDRSLLRSIVTWGHLTGAALLTVAGVLVVLLVANRGVYEPAVDRAMEATLTARLAHEAMLNQQAGLRGFLATGNEGYLEAYHRGAEAMTGPDTVTSRATAHNADLAPLVLDVRLAQQAWLEGWAAEALERGASGAPVPRSFLSRDKHLFDEYRERYDRLIERLMTVRRDAVADQRRATVVAILAGLGMAGGAAGAGWQRTRRLRREVEKPLTALLSRLESIRTGDLGPREPVAGITEFGALAAGIEETAAALAATRRGHQRQAEELSARARRQNEVLAFAREVSGNLDLGHILRGTCTHASAVADGARVVVWTRSQEAQELTPRVDNAVPGLEPVDRSLAAERDGVVSQAAHHGTVVTSSEPPAVAFPMLMGARVVGVLEVTGSAVAELPREVVQVLETMTSHAATAVEAAWLHEHISRLAMTDALTGLPNRRRLDADIEEECAAASRYARPLTVMMVDIDHFKSYNDVYGHQAADAALQRAAAAMRDAVRSGARVYRYGGEEFALVARETTVAEAAVLAERLRATVEGRFLDPGQPRAVTVSVGVACRPVSGSSPAALLAAADAALYRAKQSGRNRVELADGALAHHDRTPPRLAPVLRSA